MDYIKDRMVAISPRFNKWTCDHDIRLVANVHDELLFVGPQETMLDPTVQSHIMDVLEVRTVPIRVPLTWDGGWSMKDWREAAMEICEPCRRGSHACESKKCECDKGCGKKLVAA